MRIVIAYGNPAPLTAYGNPVWNIQSLAEYDFIALDPKTRPSIQNMPSHAICIVVADEHFVPAATEGGDRHRSR